VAVLHLGGRGRDAGLKAYLRKIAYTPRQVSRPAPLASMPQAITTKLDAQRARKILQTGLGIPEKVELPPGKYEVKFAVRDNLSGLLGTISIPLERKVFLTVPTPTRR
jgi:hypothetical protein